MRRNCLYGKQISPSRRLESTSRTVEQNGGDRVVKCTRGHPRIAPKEPHHATSPNLAAFACFRASATVGSADRLAQKQRSLRLHTYVCSVCRECRVCYRV